MRTQAQRPRWLLNTRARFRQHRLRSSSDPKPLPLMWRIVLEKEKQLNEYHQHLTTMLYDSRRSDEQNIFFCELWLCTLILSIHCFSNAKKHTCNWGHNIEATGGKKDKRPVTKKYNLWLGSLWFDFIPLVLAEISFPVSEWTLYLGRFYLHPGIYNLYIMTNNI